MRNVEREKGTKEPLRSNKEKKRRRKKAERRNLQVAVTQIEQTSTEDPGKKLPIQGTTAPSEKDEDKGKKWQAPKKTQGKRGFKQRGEPACASEMVTGRQKSREGTEKGPRPTHRQKRVPANGKKKRARQQGTGR